MRAVLIFVFIIVTETTFAQQAAYRLRGIVKDMQLNIPIDKAYVILMNSSTIHYTNSEGIFDLQLPDSLDNKDMEIWISSIGYTTKKLRLKEIDDKGYIEIELENNASILSEIVVTPSGSKRAKAILKRSFRNIDKLFIKDSYISRVHLKQSVKESDSFTKYREAFFSVYNPHGYHIKGFTHSKVDEVVYDGEIRESFDFSRNRFFGPFDAVQTPFFYFFFFYDQCKYRPRLLKRLNDYQLFIDSVRVKSSGEVKLVIECKHVQDTLVDKSSSLVYKTDYFFTLGLPLHNIESVKSISRLEVSDSLSKRVRLINLAVDYTNNNTENYAKEIKCENYDTFYEYDSLGNIIIFLDHKIITLMDILSVEKQKHYDFKNGNISYNNLFWKEMPLPEKVVKDLSKEKPLEEQFNQTVN